jgi:drug/metabolite transporter (DMT)-like permease
MVSSDSYGEIGTKDAEQSTGTFLFFINCFCKFADDCITATQNNHHQAVSFARLSSFCYYGILGLCVNALGYTLWFLALKYGDTAKISSIVFLTPFFSLIFIYLLLGEPILFSSLLGLSLIISGIVMQSGIHTRILRLKAYGSHP